MTLVAVVATVGVCRVAIGLIVCRLVTEDHRKRSLWLGAYVGPYRALQILLIALQNYWQMGLAKLRRHRLSA